MQESSPISKRVHELGLRPSMWIGNFLVIAYKEMRAIEFEINQRRKETYLKSDIPLSNFRGIEIANSRQKSPPRINYC